MFVFSIFLYELMNILFEFYNLPVKLQLRACGQAQKAFYKFDFYGAAVIKVRIICCMARNALARCQALVFISFDFIQE